MGYRLKVNPRGNVSKDLFARKMKELKELFPTWKMDLTNPGTMGLVYKYLGYCNDEMFSAGIDKFIKSELNNPTIASMLKYIPSNDLRSPKIETINTFEKFEDAYVFENGLTILIDSDCVYIDYVVKDKVVVGIDTKPIDFNIVEKIDDKLIGCKRLGRIIEP